MNFLAHLYLSGDHQGIAVGNFIGDFVKGAEIFNYPHSIQEGIRLHRAIDEFTDSHETVLKSKKRLRKRHSHYAPVIVDIFYDHYLAALWSEYHDEKLHSFAQRNYQLLANHEEFLPPKTKHMLPFMVEQDWLTSYAEIDGIRRVMQGMSRRSSFANKIDSSVEDLLKDYDDYKSEFREFFPDLIKFSESYLNKKSG
ncbi:ACP phosphodiesterase [Mangrovivirga sp. M17]|uniref:ACP phosphodiesterase n=1 Tax=Mangrovivirga halotolerans TaxID=2993936 RepID=A0ABT3RT63_9BACT|nr:ACP phosphodiesterase [Mangrovivirga halotolerans]MCX2744965.1 ACP phosphodiesterase [Mangrovivirga halotolerans]